MSRAEENREGWVGRDAMTAINASVIEEFRATGGRVGGPFAGSTILLLHHTGRDSGRPYITPLVYIDVNERMVVSATKAGHPRHPDWFYNVLARPRTTIEVGMSILEVRGVEVIGSERDRLFDAQAELRPELHAYQARAGRVIPVVAFDPVRAV